MLLLVRNSEDYTDEEPADPSFPSFLPAAAGPKQQPSTHNAPVDVVLAGQLAGSSAHLHRHQRRLEALRLVEAKVASAHRHHGGASDRPGRGDHLTQWGGSVQVLETSEFATTTQADISFLFTHGLFLMMVVAALNMHFSGMYIWRSAFGLENDCLRYYFMAWRMCRSQECFVVVGL